MWRRALSTAASSALPRNPPLQGVRVLELEGLAVAPHCGMMLADFGADVVRVDRKGRSPHFGTSALERGKRRIELDLKNEADVKQLRDLASRADVLIEPYRPGVMEHLGLGPDVLCEANPRLVYARLTGWGQTGTRASQAGHDINYIAQAGTLAMLVDGPGRKPVPPVNLLGDFAAGSVHAAFGITMALLEREKSGAGQVIDASVTDGTAYLSSFIWRLAGVKGAWREPPGSNILDGGAPFYGVYETRDGKYMAVGAIEPQFWKELLDKLQLSASEVDVPEQNDPNTWPRLREMLVEKFAARDQDEWIEVFDGSDACVSAVLSRDQALTDPHNIERGIFLGEHGGHLRDAASACPMPAPSPRLQRTPARVPEPIARSNLVLAADVEWR